MYKHKYKFSLKADSYINTLMFETWCHEMYIKYT